jgi:hypothetical protein
MNKQILFEGCRQILLFLRPRPSSSNFEKTELSKIYGKIGNREFIQRTNRKQGEPPRTPINMISVICFHLNRMENGKEDISSEANPNNSKTS